MAEAKKLVPLDDLPANLVPASDLPDELSGAAPSSNVALRKDAAGIGDQIRNAIEPVTSNPIVQGIGSAVKKGALPMAGQAAGAYAGAALTGPLAPVGIVLGESIGGGIGEMANQMAGITEPSIKEVALAMAAGPVTRGVIGGMRLFGGTLMKGMAGGDRFKEVASTIAAARLRPPVPADELFNQASQVTGYIPTYQTSRAIEGILARESGLPNTDVSRSILQAVENLEPSFRVARAGAGRGAQPALDAQAIATTAQDLRVAATAAYGAKNWRLGHSLGDIRGALLADAAASGVPVFQQAAAAARREIGIEKLEQIFRNAKPLKTFDAAMTSTKDRLFKGSFSPTETAEIRRILERLDGVAPSGFSGVVGRTLTSAAGNAVGGLGGALAGWVSPDIAAYAIGTRAGRRFMERLLVGNVWDAPQAAALTQFIRAQRAEDAKHGEVAEAVRASLQSDQTSIDAKIKAAKIGSGMGAGMSDLLATNQ